MEKQTQKQFPTIGCCGIDCGLCPRYYTAGKSKCPGCVGKDFSKKHPSCSIATCCFKNNGFETCAECTQFPCEKIMNWDIADSFVTHIKSLENLRKIKEKGVEDFIKQQKKRINILSKLIEEYDDGKSKSYYCLAAAVMDSEDMEEAIAQGKGTEDSSIDKKQQARKIKAIIKQIAEIKGMKIVYRRGS